MSAPSRIHERRYARGPGWMRGLSPRDRPGAGADELEVEAQRRTTRPVLDREAAAASGGSARAPALEPDGVAAPKDEIGV